MTDEQYTALTETLAIIRNNQKIINSNLADFENTITEKINTLQSDLSVSINNDHVLERYFTELKGTLSEIKQAVSK